MNIDELKQHLIETETELTQLSENRTLLLERIKRLPSYSDTGEVFTDYLEEFFSLKEELALLDNVLLKLLVEKEICYKNINNTFN